MFSILYLSLPQISRQLRLISIILNRKKLNFCQLEQKTHKLSVQIANSKTDKTALSVFKTLIAYKTLPKNFGIIEFLKYVSSMSNILYSKICKQLVLGSNCMLSKLVKLVNRNPSVKTLISYRAKNVSSILWDYVTVQQNCEELLKPFILIFAQKVEGQLRF